MSDPFEDVRRAAARREDAVDAWEREVRALHAAGYSLRAIAAAAGVSHDSVWRRVR